MNKYQFDDLPFEGALCAKITPCRFDRHPCPFDEFDDQICHLCLDNLIAVYKGYLKSLEEDSHGSDVSASC